MKKRFFQIQIGSPPDYEELVAYIHLSDKLLTDEFKDYDPSKGPSITYIESEEIAVITQEEGPDKVKIKFGEYVTKNEVSLDALVDIIQKAKAALID